MENIEKIKKELAEAPHVKYVVDDPSRDDVHYERYGVAIGYILRDQIYIHITQLESCLAQVEKERDAAAKIIEDATTYLEDFGSVKFALMQLKKWRGVCEEKCEGGDS